MSATFVNVYLSEFENLFSKSKGWEVVKVGNEYAFDKLLNNGNVMRVLTSVRFSDTDCRGRGKDAIRVFAFNPTKQRGVCKSVRINRTAGWQERVKSKVIITFNKAKA